MTIWGNHSATQYPDFYNAKINGARRNQVIGDEKWLKETFIPTVQQRGAAIIKARGLSSAASAANAVVDTVRSLTQRHARGDWRAWLYVRDGSYGAQKKDLSPASPFAPTAANGRSCRACRSMNSAATASTNRSRELAERSRW